MCGKTVNNKCVDIDYEIIGHLKVPNKKKPYTLTGSVCARAKTNGRTSRKYGTQYFIRTKGVVRNYMKRISFSIKHGYHCLSCGYRSTNISSSILERRSGDGNIIIK